MRFIHLFIFLLFTEFAFADGTVAFSTSEIVAAQDAGAVKLTVKFEGTPTPLGTDDFQIKFTDGTADAGYTYGPYGIPFDLSPVGYDLDSSQNTLEISVPIRLMRWSWSTYFTATLIGINGSTIGATSSIKVTIGAWYPPQAILDAIYQLKLKIKKASHIHNLVIRKKRIRALERKISRLVASIQPISEI